MLFFESPTSPRRLFVMALSKANLQLQLLLIVKKTIMPILAGLVFYYLSKEINLEVFLLNPHQYSQLLIKNTVLFTLCFVVIIFSIRTFTKIFGILLILLSYSMISFKYTFSFKPLYPLILAMLCLYSIDILIFLIRNLLRRINQSHTPR